FATGNGTFDADTGGTDYGDSLLKLGTTSGLTLADYFTPLNQDALNSADEDFGSGGVTVLPDQGAPNPHLVLSSGKEGTIYVVNRDNLGHFDAGANHIVQQLTAVVGGMWSSPAYWNGHLYYWGSGDALRMFDLTGDSTQPIDPNANQGPDFI